MAKSKSFFSLRTGSTKSLTFQVNRGQQITKDRVTKVSNPQSDAQMKQRILIHMVAQCRNMLRGLVDHSFEGVPYGYQSLQHFSALNLAKGTLKVNSWVPKGVVSPGIADYIVSAGTLTPFNMVYEEKKDILCLPFQRVEMNNLAGNLKIGDPIPADFYTSFLEKNPFFKKGDQLTFLALGNDYDDVDDVDNITVDNNKFYIDRLILDPDASSNSVWKLRFNHGGILEYSNGHMAIALISISDKGKGGICFGIETATDQSSTRAMTVLYSRLVNNIWKRSFARLHFDHLNHYPISFEEVLSTYVKSGSASAKYLNQGSESTGIQG